MRRNHTTPTTIEQFLAGRPMRSSANHEPERTPPGWVEVVWIAAIPLGLILLVEAAMFLGAILL